MFQIKQESQNAVVRTHLENECEKVSHNTKVSTDRKNEGLRNKRLSNEGLRNEGLRNEGLRNEMWKTSHVMDRQCQQGQKEI